MKKSTKIANEGRERIGKYQEPPKNVPKKVAKCIDNYKLDINKLRSLDNLDKYLVEHNVDEDCMDIVNMHISRVRPPQRPSREFSQQLRTCYNFIVKSGLGDNDTTSKDLFELITQIRQNIYQKGYITDDDKLKIFLLSKCYTAYHLYGL